MREIDTSEKTDEEWNGKELTTKYLFRNQSLTI